MMHGILPIYKPRGYTSHDIVHQIRRIMGQKRVGHTGTLDPEVEGVLPICLGQATRVVEYIQNRPKRYRGKMRLGISTDTEDQTGSIIEKQAVTQLTRQQIEEVFEQFHGEIEQIPPMYSAVKVQGKRLYELARQGKEVARKPRKAMIYHLQCLSDVVEGAFPIIEFDVICAKGTYVRTLCVDIGKKLGYPAHLASLIRTESGPFHMDDCYSLDQLSQIQSEEERRQLLFSLDEALGHLPCLIIHESDVPRVLNGASFQVGELNIDAQIIRIYSESGRFCALYRLEKSMAKPEKVFREVIH